jgi:hypothetical protein
MLTVNEITLNNVNKSNYAVIHVVNKWIAQIEAISSTKIVLSFAVEDNKTITVDCTYNEFTALINAGVYTLHQLQNITIADGNDGTEYTFKVINPMQLLRPEINHICKTMRNTGIKTATK